MEAGVLAPLRLRGLRPHLTLSLGRAGDLPYLRPGARVTLPLSHEGRPGSAGDTRVAAVRVGGRTAPAATRSPPPTSKNRDLSSRNAPSCGRCLPTSLRPVLPSRPLPAGGDAPQPQRVGRAALDTYGAAGAISRVRLAPGRARGQVRRDRQRLRRPRNQGSRDDGRPACDPLGNDAFEPERDRARATTTRACPRSPAPGSSGPPTPAPANRRAARHGGTRRGLPLVGCPPGSREPRSAAHRRTPVTAPGGV